MTPTLESRIVGGMLGLLVGDALGVPYEFHAASAIPPPDRIDFKPPLGFPRSHASVEPGTYSDDGALALCLLASILQQGRMDLEDFGRRLVNWRECGYLAVDNEVFDVGIQTSEAIRALQSGTPALEAGPSSERANGNGSLMRVLPLALWHKGSDEELIRDARLQSRVTHGHVRSQLCCALYCLWARRIMESNEAPWESAVRALRMSVASSERSELALCTQPTTELSGSGYVVDSLHSARASFASGLYENVVKAAIRFGNDTDTTAAVAGGIAGVREGVEGIPLRWRNNLRGRELFMPLIEQLVAHRRQH